MLKYFFVLVCLTGAACSIPQAYHGPEQPRAQLAYLQGFSTVCYGRLSIEQLDGEFDGVRLMTLPGQHSLTIDYWGVPYEPHQYSDVVPLEVCIPHLKFQVNFLTRAGYRYNFDVNERGDSAGESTAELTVLESNSPGAVESKRIPAEVKLLSSTTRCNLSRYYSECFGD